MSSFIPEQPTPAQRRLIQSDWFQAAWAELSASTVTTALWERQPDGASSMPAASTLTVSAPVSARATITRWEQLPSDEVSDMPTITMSSDAYYMGIVQSILDGDRSAPGAKKEALSYWGATTRVAARAILPVALYHPERVGVFEELIAAMELLAPEDTRFFHEYLTASGAYVHDGGFYANADDSSIIHSFFKRSEQQTLCSAERLAHVESRLARPRELEPEELELVRQLINALPGGRPNSFDPELRFRRLQHIDPVVLLAACFEVAMEPERGLIRPDERGQGYIRYRWSPKNLLWHLVVNIYRSRAAVVEASQRMMQMLFFVISSCPVGLTRQAKALYIDHSYEHLLDSDVFSTCAALVVQSRQLMIAKEMFHPGWNEGEWSTIVQSMIGQGLSFSRALLQVWSFGTKAHRSQLMEEHIRSISSPADILAVALDVLEVGVTPTRAKTLLAVLEERAPEFTREQQELLAIASAKALKGKALKTIQGHAPDVDWAAILKEHAPVKVSRSSRKKTTEPEETVHASLRGIKARKLPAFVDVKLADELGWRDEERALNVKELGVLVTVLRESGPGGAQHPDIERVIRALEPKRLDAFGFGLFELWESRGSAARDKWMLFQLRHTGAAAKVMRLGQQHDWESWASSGKWARACWYLEVISDMGPSAQNDALFIGLLDAGKVDSTLQHTARRMFPKFAASLGCEGVHEYLTARGLLGHVPRPGALSFAPGETSLEVDGEQVVVVVEQAQARLERVIDHHTLSITDAHRAQLPELERYAEEVDRHALQWSAFYERMQRLGESMTSTRARQALDEQGPVHQSVFCSLLWRATRADVVVRFDPEGTCYSVDYEPVEVDGEEVFEVVLFDALEEPQKRAWLEHLTESEVILPFNPFDPGRYLARVHELFDAPFDEDNAEGVSDVIWGLSSRGWREAHVLDNGIVWEHYKTLAHYNVRVFIEHTGVDVGSDRLLESPGRLVKLRFTDLLGDSIAGEEVEPGALVTLCDDLAAFLVA